ncbi:hypothetical protein [Photobacterium sp. GB-3]|uniref:hypothetical protein n=1 Tax=Photobacterium sp. GB-3 TaxID=2022110 RepID=UPI000D152ED8|nr:hypothetical protein [Photobacterium sp. GB-3]PSV56456.1 hypothetical protein C9J43_11985 [Photobacterium sp. GB-3]
MAFVIDSNEWDFNGVSPDAVSSKLEQLLDRILIANERNEEIYVGNDLQSKSVYNGMDLWTFLYDDHMEDLDGGIINELSAFLNNANYYESDETLWPNNFPNFTIKDDTGISVGLDVEFAHMNNVAKKPFACLTLNGSGVVKTNSANFGSSEVYMVSDETSHKSFWRQFALSTVRDTSGNLEALSSHMYPNLHFFDGVWDGISKFEGGYSRVSSKLQKYLECFDDYGAWVFSEPPPALHPTDTELRQVGVSPSNDLIERRFSGLGLEVAPEKPNVRGNTDCYNARLISFKSVASEKSVDELYCEWHGKLELHTNRIHIYPPIVDSKGKLIVAIFHKHLPLP